MTRQILPLLLSGLLSSCVHQWSQHSSVTAAVASRERGKGHQLISWNETGTIDGKDQLRIVYSAVVRTPAGEGAVQDTVSFYRTGDGILLEQPAGLIR